MKILQIRLEKNNPRRDNHTPIKKLNLEEPTAYVGDPTLLEHSYGRLPDSNSIDKLQNVKFVVQAVSLRHVGKSLRAECPNTYKIRISYRPKCR